MLSTKGYPGVSVSLDHSLDANLQLVCVNFLYEANAGAYLAAMFCSAEDREGIPHIPWGRSHRKYHPRPYLR